MGHTSNPNTQKTDFVPGHPRLRGQPQLYTKMLSQKQTNVTRVTGAMDTLTPSSQMSHRQPEKFLESEATMGYNETLSSDLQTPLLRFLIQFT